MRRGGELRLVIRDADGDEWAHVDDTVLWEEGWRALAVPHRAFELDRVQSRGNGRLDLRSVDAVMVQILSGRAAMALGDRKVQLTQPIVLRYEPDP